MIAALSNTEAVVAICVANLVLVVCTITVTTIVVRRALQSMAHDLNDMVATEVTMNFKTIAEGYGHLFRGVQTLTEQCDQDNDRIANQIAGVSELIKQRIPVMPAEPAPAAAPVKKAARKAPVKKAS